MITVVGLGSAGCNIATQFEQYTQYNVFKISRDSSHDRNHYKLSITADPERAEKECPNLSEFFKTIDDHVFFFCSELSSNVSLALLEQIKDKKIDVYYIKPDISLLTGIPKMQENVVFGVLQEYARSGLFNSITLISNPAIEEAIGEVPISRYYEVINSTISSTIHYINYFKNTKPIIGQAEQPAEIQRIRTIGSIHGDNFDEKSFFSLDIPREQCYYIAINKEKLETDGSLHKKITTSMKEKTNNGEIKVSYAIYETDYEDFGFCVTHTNAVQKNP